jgi:hypothetical protein
VSLAVGGVTGLRVDQANTTAISYNGRVYKLVVWYYFSYLYCTFLCVVIRIFNFQYKTKMNKNKKTKDNTYRNPGGSLFPVSHCFLLVLKDFHSGIYFSKIIKKYKNIPTYPNRRLKHRLCADDISKDRNGI